MVEVVKLSRSPAVNDIPGQLRQMADLIESGEVKATSAMFVIPQSGDYPTVYGWGDHLGDLGYIGLSELTKAYFVNYIVTR